LKLLNLFFAALHLGFCMPSDSFVCLLKFEPLALLLQLLLAFPIFLFEIFPDLLPQVFPDQLVYFAGTWLLLIVSFGTSTFLLFCWLLT
jgi:hypothetical protein